MKPDLDRPRRPNTDKLDPTRARPEPWFVGNGQGLMIAVLVICGVLVVVRIASFLWMAETAWTWWTAPPARSAVAHQDVSIRAVPRPAVPKVDPRKANARVRGNPGE